MKYLEAVLLAICIASAAERCMVQAVHIIGGDIALTNEGRATYEADANRDTDPFAPQNAVVRNERSLWPNNIVPYEIASSLTGSSRAMNAINAAINEYQQRTCISFVRRTNQQDYVRFFRGNGCYSYIGRIGGPQDISIGSGCESKGIIMHEIFHALGRWHEQSRPDRDGYVRINFQNIQEGVESNFETTSTAFVTTQGVPYDIGSIMHYGAYAFSRNRQPTIVPVNSRISLNALGQRNGFSNSDLSHIQALYCGGGDSSSSSWSSWSSWSSCSQTCNGGRRSRMRQCIGGSSCQGSNIDFEDCNTQSCPRPATWGSWGAWSICSSTCGGGRQERRRRCDNGNNCVGSTAQFRDCNTQNCPLSQSWGSWGSWSSCSSTCQGGNRIRRRICQNGNNCPGADFQTSFCNTNIPCVSQPNPNTGEWSVWSECTRSCGGGVRFRTRMCGTNDCESQQQECNTQDCNPEPELQGLQHVGCYFVPPRSQFIGLLEGSTEDLSDDPVTRRNPIRKCGSAAQQRRFTYFAISVGYCISGSNRLSDYQYVQSNLCQNGVGNYYRGYFVMDIYQIVNQGTFADSLVAEPFTTELPTNATDFNEISSAPVISSSSLLLIASIFMTLIPTLLLN